MLSRTRRGSRRVLVVAATTGLLTAAIATPAMAAPELSTPTLTSTVAGGSVTVKTTIESGAGLTADNAGVCIRDADGGNHDLHNDAVWLSANGTDVTRTAQFDSGTYTYWSCAEVGGDWHDLGERKTFTVGNAATRTAGGEAMPVGDLPHFKQVFTDDFNTDLARGSFPGGYESKWASYTGFADTLGGGTYNRDIIAMDNGVMDLHLHQADGKGQVAAPVPLVDGEWNSQTYGKYTVRFKSDDLPMFRTAWMLWPTSGDWSEGEIDFPEGGLGGGIWGFNHCLGNSSENCGWVDTDASFTDWHTASIEWTPAAVVFYLDGKKVMTSTNAVPSTPMRWILQTESGSSNGNRVTSNGHVQIDWVTMYDYTG